MLWLEQGFKIPLLRPGTPATARWDPANAATPEDIPPFCERNRPSCFIEVDGASAREFIDRDVLEDESIGVIDEIHPPMWPPPAHYSALHAVPKKGADRFRRCLDARRINEFIHLRRFRYQTLDDVLAIIRSLRGLDLYLLAYDLRKGYYHIALARITAIVLVFAWTFLNGITRVFRYNALPFGVALACYVFTKVMRAFAKYWAALKVLLGTYLDDGLFICRSLEEALLVSEHLRWLAPLLRLTFSDKGHVDAPTRLLIYLGLGIDVGRGECFLPPKKLDKLLGVLVPLVGKAAAPARTLQSIAGSLNAARHAVVGARLVARPLTNAVAQAETLGSGSAAVVPLNALARRAIRWLAEYLPLAPPAPLWRPEQAYRLFTDASGLGYCAALDARPCASPDSLDAAPCRSIFGTWPEDIRGEDNSWRELRAVVIAASELFPLVRGSHILVRCDNSSAVAAAVRGSLSEGMMDLALRLFGLCAQAGVTLDVLHIAGRRNVLADAGSRTRRPTLHSGLARRIRHWCDGTTWPHVHVASRHDAPFDGSARTPALYTVDARLRSEFLAWLCTHGSGSAWLVPYLPGTSSWLALQLAASQRGWFLQALPAEWRLPRDLFFAEGTGGAGRFFAPHFAPPPVPFGGYWPYGPGGYYHAALPAPAPSPPPTGLRTIASPGRNPGTASAGPLPSRSLELDPWAPAAQPRVRSLLASARATQAASIQGTTRAKYDVWWGWYLAFCGGELDPVESDSLLAFAAHLESEGKKAAYLAKILSGIRWQLAARGLEPPPPSTTRLFLRGAAQRNPQTTQQATPLESSMLDTWLRSPALASKPVAAALADVAMVLIGIACLLRSEQVLHLRHCDVVALIGTPGFDFSFPWEKTNPGALKPARVVRVLDPPPRPPGQPRGRLWDFAPAVRAYLARFPPAVRLSTDLLFRGADGLPVTYDYINGLIKEVAAASGAQGSWTSHTLRRTGATLAALGGATTRELRVLGGWSHRSTTAEQYVDAAVVLSGRGSAYMTAGAGLTLPLAIGAGRAASAGAPRL
eukprot:tig00000057_g32.t1